MNHYNYICLRAASAKSRLFFKNMQQKHCLAKTCLKVKKNGHVHKSLMLRRVGNDYSKENCVLNGLKPGKVKSPSFACERLFNR